MPPLTNQELIQICRDSQIGLEIVYAAKAELLRRLAEPDRVKQLEAQLAETERQRQELYKLHYHPKPCPPGFVITMVPDVLIGTKVEDLRQLVKDKERLDWMEQAMNEGKVAIMEAGPGSLWTGTKNIRAGIDVLCGSD